MSLISCAMNMACCADSTTQGPRMKLSSPAPNSTSATLKEEAILLTITAGTQLEKSGSLREKTLQWIGKQQKENSSFYLAQPNEEFATTIYYSAATSRPCRPTFRQSVFHAIRRYCSA